MAEKGEQVKILEGDTLEITPEDIVGPAKIQEIVQHNSSDKSTTAKEIKDPSAENIHKK